MTEHTIDPARVCARLRLLYPWAAELNDAQILEAFDGSLAYECAAISLSGEDFNAAVKNAVKSDLEAVTRAAQSYLARAFVKP